MRRLESSARTFGRLGVEMYRKDFRSFLNAMERRGRDEVDVIARETSNETGKTEEEVRQLSHGLLGAPQRTARTGSAS